MTPANVYDLIAEMREKKRLFSHFANFVNFNFEHTRTEFKDALIRSYAHFLDALDAALGDYNEKENQTPLLLLPDEVKEPETVVANGKLAPRSRGAFEPPEILGCKNGRAHCLKELKGGALYCTVCHARF